MSSLPFFLSLALLTVVSAVLAWFALVKVRPPADLGRPNDRGWQVLAVQLGLRAELEGPPATWRLDGEVDGRKLEVRVVELDGERWTEARIELPATVLPDAIDADVEDGTVQVDGWLIRAVDGADGDDLRALIDGLADRARGLSA